MRLVNGLKTTTDPLPTATEACVDKSSVSDVFGEVTACPVLKYANKDFSLSLPIK